MAVSYTHLRAYETVLDLVCRLLLEKKISYIPLPPLQTLLTLIYLVLLLQLKKNTKTILTY